MEGPAKVCFRCNSPLLTSLDACLRCGASRLSAASVGGDWSVTAGPISSQSFRQKAIETLEAVGLAGLDPVAAEVLLSKERVTLATGLRKLEADALVEAMGRKETTARATRGVLTRPARWDMLALPALALVIATGYFLGALGVVLGLVLAATLGILSSKRRAPLLGTLPVELHEMPHRSEGLIHRLFDSSDALDSDSREVLRDTGRSTFSLLARLIDRDDMPAQIAGGSDGAMGDAVMAVAQELVTLAEGAANEKALNDDALARLAQIQAAVDGAAQRLKAIDELGETEDTSDPVELLEDEVAALEASIQAVVAEA